MKLTLLVFLLIFTVSASFGGMKSYGEKASTPPAVDAILEKAQDALEERYDRDTYRFDLAARWIPGTMARLPENRILEVIPTGSIERYTTFNVLWESGGRRHETEVQLQLKIEKKLPVARDRVVSGTVIGREDLESRWVEVLRDRGQLVTCTEEIAGKTVRRTLAAGQPVRKADLSTAYIVEAGEVVTLVLENRGTRIALTAVARENGAINEKIRLYSDDTRRTYLGKVNGPNEVIWEQTF